MKQTRKIMIRDRVFALDDLRRIASVFEKQCQLAEKSGHDADIEYYVEFSDNTSVESDSTEVLDDDVLTRTGRPVRIRFDFRNWKLKRYLSFSVVHGDSSCYGNEASASANEAPWVKENFLSLKEAIEIAKPQRLWPRRHKTLLLILIALGVGCLIRLFWRTVFGVVIWALDTRSVIRPLPEDSPLRILVVQSFPIVLLLDWLFHWAIGFMVFAFEIRSWFLSLWPSIELDIGPDHLKTERTRRKRLTTIVVLIVLPIALSAVHDVIQHLLP